MNYIIHYDVAALLVTFTVMLHYYSKRTIHTGMTRIFTFMMAAVTISNLLDLITVYTISRVEFVPLWLNIFLNMVYLIFFNSVTVIYCVYVVAAVGENRLATLQNYLLLTIPFAIDVLLILTTPFTKLVFYFTEDGIYMHGSGLAIMYAIAVYYVVLALVNTILNHKKLSESQKLTVVCYTVGSIITMILQIVVQGLLIAQLAMSLVVLLIYMSLENPDDFTDKHLAILNRHAFTEILTSYLRSGREFEIMGVQIGGIGYLRNVVGLSNTNGLMKMIAEFLESIAGHHRKIFYIDQNRFMIMGDGSNQRWDMFTQVLRKRFSKPFQFENMEFSLDVALSVLPNKEHEGITQADELIHMMEISLQEAEESGAELFVISSDKVLEKGRREGELIHIMKDALRNHEFEVYYQPIYSVKSKRYTAAEALIRLKNDTLGYISPEEFIPLAEQHGLIIDIGEFVFREVCRFMSEHDMWERGIEYIDVNLSVVQCMQENLHEQLIGIMDEYRLPHSSINLEITETAAVMSAETLRNNMSHLMERGVNFSLDDYGTGFSNTASIIEYPFHTIKLDKSMLWSATDSEKAMCALEHMIGMIKSMQMEVVCEGVETSDQATALEHMGCDYFQGYYYSKPVSSDDFVSVLERDQVYSLLEE